MSFLNGENNIPSHPRLDDSEVIQSTFSGSDKSGDTALVNDWSRLPASIVEQVYLNLNRTDQFHTSLVCKNWLQEYESPHLWRYFKYYITEYRCSCEIIPYFNFPQKFAKFFKHIEIICKKIRSDLVDGKYEDFILFLNFISENSQLHSIKFINMNKFSWYLDEEDYMNLLLDTMAFFANQKSLELVEFRDSFYFRDDGALMLKAVCEYNMRTLKKVILKGFVLNSLKVELLDVDVWRVYCSLNKLIMNLTTIQTDYTQLFECILMVTLDEQEQFDKKLSLLEIKCEGPKRIYFQGIPAEAWSNLCKMCPNLKVHMTLTSKFHPRSDYSFYIVPHIPIRVLHFGITTPLESENVDIGEFLEHLICCGCHKHLEYLTIYWLPHIKNAAAHLKSFIRTAVKLKTLMIFFSHPISDLEDLFKAWFVKKPPCLKSVYIYSLQLSSEEDSQYLSRLVDEYLPILQILDLHVTIKAGLQRYFFNPNQSRFAFIEI